MSKSTQELTTLRFAGPRFEGGGLEIDVLPELVAYKRLVLETAKELWRRDHPGRERLPKGFEESVAIKFFRLDKGSTVVPLMREIAEGQLPNLIEDELDQAAEIIEATIEAAADDRLPPDILPKPVIPLFEEFGKSLGEGECIYARARKRPNEVKYTREIRQRVATWLERTYEDVVDLIGEVRSTDLDPLNFTLRLDDNRKVPAKFETSQEALITEALREHATRRLRIRGRAEFSSLDGSMRRILRVDEIRPLAIGEVEFDPNARPIWETLAEIGAQVPAKEWARVPRDLSEHLDHYLYGTPKDEE
jgi:hypothetical protein